MAHRMSVLLILLARPNFHWPAYKKCKWENDKALLMLNYIVFVANTPITISVF